MRIRSQKLLGVCMSVAMAACGRGSNGVISQPLPANPPNDAALGSDAAQRGASPDGTERVLHRFKGGTDGSQPLAGLTVLNGVLYGTTAYGGTSNDGTVFKVSPSGRESRVYSFKGGGDGAFPQANLIAVNGILYGTTSRGGAFNDGTVFEVRPSGTESVIYSFKGGADGWFPQANLIAVNGILYGTTYFGGGTGCYGSGCGTVFKITTSGTENVLYSFQGGADAAAPAASVIAVKGELYGTTLGGNISSSQLCPDQGVPGCGTVFEVSTSGTDRVLRGFEGGNDGRTPTASLVKINGKLYGTTDYGGASGNGTVFKIGESGSGYKVIHSFQGADGSVPQAALIKLSGTLYGTTDYGGASYGGAYSKSARPVSSTSFTTFKAVRTAGCRQGAWSR